MNGKARQWAVAAAAVAGLWCAYLAGTVDGAATRTFNSDVAFEVYAVVGGEQGLIGNTPSEDALAIPPCDWWYVAPRAPVDMAAVRRELLAQRIPGLKIRKAPGRSLRYLRGLTALETLDLSQWRPRIHRRRDPQFEITEANIDHLKGLTGLRRLDLSYTSVDEGELEHLTSLTSLEELGLRGTCLLGTGLAHVARLPALRKLDLSYSDTPAFLGGLEHLSASRTLASLDLMYAQVTDARLACVCKIEGLRTLNLTSTPVTDAGLQHIAGLTNLQVLKLMDTKVTDAGLAHLRDLSALQSLDLSFTEVTDAGLAHLKALPALQMLNVYSTGVTAEGVADLKKALPDLEVDGL